MSSPTIDEAPARSVTLRDGSSVTVRPITRDDGPLVARAYERLSPESRRRRFVVSPPRLTDEDLRHMTDVDHRRHDALIAVEESNCEMVGEARYVMIPGKREAAEVATWVAEDWRGRGLATALLTELTERARASGIERYIALVSADNQVVLDALERIGARHTGMDGDQLELEIDLRADGLPARMRGVLQWAARGQLALLGAVARRFTSWPLG